MQNLKVNTNYPTRLYGSAVVEGRQKASSLYQKRTQYDIPTLHIGDSKVSQELRAPSRKYSNEETMKKISSYKANNADSSLGKGKYEGYSGNPVGFSGRDNKSSGRYVPSTDRSKYNQNEALDWAPSRRKNELFDAKNEGSKINQSRDDYARIVEKLNKKGKIIQELQKLCDNKVSDSIRNQDKYVNGTYQPYSPARTKKKNYDSEYSINIMQTDSKPGEKVSTPSTFNIDLTKSENFDKISQSKTASFLNLQEVKNNQRNVRGSEVKKTNPEDFSQRKFNSAYSSPKEAQKNIESSFKNVEKKEKPSSFLDNYIKNEPSKNVSGSGQKTIADMPYSQDIYTPVITRKVKELQEPKQYKHAKDIRQTMEIKNVKKTSTFSNKKVTINDFHLKKTLGEGKFGVVYQAFHKETKALFALKKINKEVIKSNLMIDQLLLEIRIQIFCNHDNVLKLYGFFDDAQNIYLILEYMEEGTLFTHLKVNKTLKEDDAKEKLKDIAKAVIYLHDQGIAHRDIKPENIVMSNGVGKLCDFGWAAICTDRRKTYCGTFDYVAPQILEGSQYDASVDLWCLGVLAYELLVGKAPFYHISRKQTMKKIMKVEKLEYPANISAQAVSFIDSLIKKNPEQRLNGQNILRHPFLSASGRQTI